MHFVDCEAEPDLFTAIKDNKNNKSGKPIWQLTPDEYKALISYLQSKFHGICGYCEIKCEIGGPPNLSKNEVEHFRPRSHYPHLTFDWENLIYVCTRCNKSKDDQFPGKEIKGFVMESLKNEAALAGREFIEPSDQEGFVSPRDRNNLAERYFVYSRDGRILPNPGLDDHEWSKAYLTIEALDLNPIGGPRKVNLCLFRQLFASVRMNELSREKLSRIKERMLPFSSFMLWSLSNR